MANRRNLMALAGVAFADVMTHRVASATATCTTGNCSGGQTCCADYTCTPTGNGNSKYCKHNEILPHCPTCPVCPTCPTCPPPVVCPTPQPGPWHCIVDTDCGGNGLVCSDSVCCTVQTVVVNNNQTVEVTTPVTVINNCGRKKKHHHKHHN